MLRTLEQRGYVHHAASEKVYRLGPAINALAAQSTESAIVRAAAPALTHLRATTRETVNFGVINGSRIVYASTLDGTHQPRMSASIGAEVEPHATALGKAILSRLPVGVRARLLPPAPFPAYTPATITSPKALEAELLVAAQSGFAVEIEESTLGASCIAVPIVDAEGLALGGIADRIGVANGIALYGVLGGVLMVATSGFALLGFPPFGSFFGELLILSALVGSGHMLVFGAFCMLIIMTFVATGRTIFPMIWGEPKEARTWPRQTFVSAAPKMCFLAALIVLGVYIPASVNELIKEVSLSLDAP